MSEYNKCSFGHEIVGAVCSKCFEALEAALAESQARVKEIEQWVADLQSGMFINCVYCGHQYGPKDKVPMSMADVLKAHIEICPKHPLSKATEKIGHLEARLARVARVEGAYYQCQFCKEDDFDLEGLWFHYDNRNCDAYRQTGLKAVGMHINKIQPQEKP